MLFFYHRAIKNKDEYLIYSKDLENSKGLEPQIVMLRIQISHGHGMAPKIIHEYHGATILASLDSQCGSHHVILIHALSSLAANVNFQSNQSNCSIDKI